jgi:hypothetical protein
MSHSTKHGKGSPKEPKRSTSRRQPVSNMSPTSIPITHHQQNSAITFNNLLLNSDYSQNLSDIETYLLNSSYDLPDPSLSGPRDFSISSTPPYWNMDPNYPTQYPVNSNVPSTADSTTTNYAQSILDYSILEPVVSYSPASQDFKPGPDIGQGTAQGPAIQTVQNAHLEKVNVLPAPEFLSN